MPTRLAAEVEPRGQAASVRPVGSLQAHALGTARSERRVPRGGKGAVVVGLGLVLG